MNYNNVSYNDTSMVGHYGFVNNTADAAACSPVNIYPQACGGQSLDCNFKFHCNERKDVNCSCANGSVSNGVGGCNCFQPRDLQWWVGSM